MYNRFIVCVQCVVVCIYENHMHLNATPHSEQVSFNYASRAAHPRVPTRPLVIKADDLLSNFTDLSNRTPEGLSMTEQFRSPDPSEHRPAAAAASTL